MTPHRRGGSRSRSRQGAHVGGKTMKKNKIKNKRTKPKKNEFKNMNLFSFQKN